MFDEIAPKNPNEPEDIFSGTPEPAAPLELKSALANKKLIPVGGTRQSVPINSGQAGVNPSMPEIEISPPLLSKKSIFVVIGIIGHILLTLKPILEAENTLDKKYDYL